MIKKMYSPWSPITLAIAVCLYICVTRLMTWVKGLSVATTADPIPFISFSHSAKLAEASCKQGESKDSEAASFISSTTLFLHLVLYCFWDIKGKTINGAAGCPTFPGRERKKEGEKKKRERWRIPKEATPLRLGCCVRWVMSISQL